MPGAPGRAAPQDQVGDGALLLPFPGEHRVCSAPEVCVWAQQGIEEHSHGTLAPAFKALGQVLQVLQREHGSGRKGQEEGRGDHGRPERPLAERDRRGDLSSGLSLRLCPGIGVGRCIRVLKALMSPAADIYLSNSAGPCACSTENLGSHRHSQRARLRVGGLG